MKIVINTCYGGFGLSDEALKLYNEYSEHDETNYYHIERDDPALVRVVEELDEKADGNYASLKVVEIPDGVEWCIDEYDGMEHIAEEHSTWN